MNDYTCADLTEMDLARCAMEKMGIDELKSLKNEIDELIAITNVRESILSRLRDDVKKERQKMRTDLALEYASRKKVAENNVNYLEEDDEPLPKPKKVLGRLKTK
jgi:hypothetical protein